MARIPDFPFFGAGDATYFEWAEVQVLFVRDPSPKEKKAITAGVPAPLRDSVTWNRRHLGVASGQVVHVDIARAWPEKVKRKPADDEDEEGGSFFASDSQ